MSNRAVIGRTIRRLRTERGVSQQALAARLGISGSYLNLLEHDQRAVTASLLLKLADVFRVDLAVLSGSEERQLEVGLREALTDPLLGSEDVPEMELAQIAGASPNAARAILGLYRAYRLAREDSAGIALPSGRKMLLPNEEARDFFHERANHFPALEQAAEAIAAELPAAQYGSSHALAERLRHRHAVTVTVQPNDGSLRTFDPATRVLTLSEALPRESRGFQLAFQLALFEVRETVDRLIGSPSGSLSGSLSGGPSSEEAAMLIRVGLLNYTAAALIMPYGPFAHAAAALRHDIDLLAARFGVSAEQTCQRLASLQRDGARGLPFFFLRTDPAGNVAKRFSAAGFPFARYGGSCPRWVVHRAFASPGEMKVQVAELPDGDAYLCFARSVQGPPGAWGEPRPLHVIAMGCRVAHANEVVYADGLDVDRARVGIGLSCRLCDRQDCTSRAFPPLAHRLVLDTNATSATPYRFEPKQAAAPRD